MGGRSVAILPAISRGSSLRRRGGRSWGGRLAVMGLSHRTQFNHHGDARYRTQYQIGRKGDRRQNRQQPALLEHLAPGTVLRRRYQ